MEKVISSKETPFVVYPQNWQQKTISKLHFSDNLNRMIFTLLSQAYLPPGFLPRSSSSYLHTEKIESLKCEKIHSTLARHLVSLPTPVSTFSKAKLGGLSSKSLTRGRLGTVLLACQGHDSMKDLATTWCIMGCPSMWRPVTSVKYPLEVRPNLLVRINCQAFDWKWRKAFPQRKCLSWCLPRTYWHEQKTISKLQFSDD